MSKKKVENIRLSHYLKIDHCYFQAIQEGRKRAEFRKNDRDFQTYDEIELVSNFNGDKLTCRVTHILHGDLYGIPVGYCMMSIEVLEASK
jgi:hypothetical protein